MSTRVNNAPNHSTLSDLPDSSWEHDHIPMRSGVECRIFNIIIRMQHGQQRCSDQREEQEQDENKNKNKNFRFNFLSQLPEIRSFAPGFFLDGLE
jgi:hypothetical protein